MNKKKILITGCAGFIGYHISAKLCKENFNVIGIDNLNNYYDVNLKKDRVRNLNNKYKKNFTFYKIDINHKNLKKKLSRHKIHFIFHLAAQAGVRESIKSPDKYFNNNIKGFYNIITYANEIKVKHFIYASTSSVYGNNLIYPSKEIHNTNKPLSFYAASKKCNEIIAYSFSNIYKLPTTGLRFFTVFGPYGRPDMALFKFTKNILKKRQIYVFNKGNHVRDFTYIDNISNNILKIINKYPKGKIPYEIINFGSGKPKTLNYFIKIIEKNLDAPVKKKYLNYQKGDMIKTSANISYLKKKIKISKFINLENGIKLFINWYKKYYKI